MKTYQQYHIKVFTFDTITGIREFIEEVEQYYDEV